MVLCPQLTDLVGFRVQVIAAAAEARAAVRFLRLILLVVKEVLDLRSYLTSTEEEAVEVQIYLALSRDYQEQQMLELEAVIRLEEVRYQIVAQEEEALHIFQLPLVEMAALEYSFLVYPVRR